MSYGAESCRVCRSFQQWGTYDERDGGGDFGACRIVPGQRTEVSGDEHCPSFAWPVGLIRRVISRLHGRVSRWI